MLFSAIISVLIFIRTSTQETDNYGEYTTETNWRMYPRQYAYKITKHTNTPYKVQSSQNYQNNKNKTDQKSVQYAPLELASIRSINQYNLETAEKIAVIKHLEPRLMEENNYVSSHKDDYRSFILGHNIAVLQSNLKPTQMVFKSSSSDFNLFKSTKDSIDYEYETNIRPIKNFFSFNRQPKKQNKIDDRYYNKIENDYESRAFSKYLSEISSTTEDVDVTYRPIPPVPERYIKMLPPSIVPPPPPYLLPLSHPIPPVQPAAPVPIVPIFPPRANNMEQQFIPKYEYNNFGNDVSARLTGNPKPPRLHLNIRRIYSAGHVDSDLPLLPEDPININKKISNRIQPIYPLRMKVKPTPFKTVLYPVQELKKKFGYSIDTTNILKLENYTS